MGYAENAGIRFFEAGTANEQLAAALGGRLDEGLSPSVTNIVIPDDRRRKPKIDPGPSARLV
jgi:hypothetical protein